MSDIAPVQDQSAGQPVAAPVPEAVAPEVAADIPVEPAQEKTVPPFWANRHYIKRSFNFYVSGKPLEGNFFDLGGKWDIDGLYDGKEFESLTHLFTLANWAAPEQDEVFNKIERLLKS